MNDQSGVNPPVTGEDGTTVSARRVGLVVASLSTFCTSFLISALNVALPVLQKEYHMNTVLLSWVAMVSILTSAMLGFLQSGWQHSPWQRFSAVFHFPPPHS